LFSATKNRGDAKKPVSVSRLNFTSGPAIQSSP
jgi:hypothetical protein